MVDRLSGLRMTISGNHYAVPLRVGKVVTMSKLGRLSIGIEDVIWLTDLARYLDRIVYRFVS